MWLEAEDIKSNYYNKYLMFPFVYEILKVNLKKMLNSTVVNEAWVGCGEGMEGQTLVNEYRCVGERKNNS